MNCVELNRSVSCAVTLPKNDYVSYFAVALSGFECSASRYLLPKAATD
jgi:hypothetical protein